MLATFQRYGSSPSFRAFHVGVPPRGEHRYRSLALSVPLICTHFRGRTMPCLGPGCPICPVSARSYLLLPAVNVHSRQLSLVMLVQDSASLALAAEWPAGRDATFKRESRKVRVVSSTPADHANVGPISDRDIEETLAKMWGLPSPGNFKTEEEWLSSALTAVNKMVQ